MSEAQRIAAKLTEAQRRVLLMMSGSEHVYPMAQTASDAAVPLAETRKIIRQFRADGLGRYGPLWNEDEYRPQGSGTWLTPLGLEVRKILEAQS